VILAGDIGGTNTRLALFDGDLREPVRFGTFRSGEHRSLEEMVEMFLADGATPTAASFGVAGTIRNGHTKGVNLEWSVDAGRLRKLLGRIKVGLINDLEANAYGIASLGPEDIAVLNEGNQHARGNLALISAGTGLGQAGLYWDGKRHRPFATEGGHADFAPRDELELSLQRYLRTTYGHVSYERVCSGMGLVNIHDFLRESRGEYEHPRVLEELDGPDPAAAIGRAALAGTSETCARALDLFVSVYGSQAGNLALTLMATGGVYLGGGIAPKVLPKLADGAFMRSFADKGRFAQVLERIPVRVILNDKAALLGAARHAANGGLQ
jgi:glucokinase